MRLVLYTGKGGVGKTTTAATTAVCAAQRGRRTLIVSADAAHSLGDVLDHPLGSDPVPLTGNLTALEIDARVEMARHWGQIRDYLVSLFRYQGIDEVVAEELALLPGAEELTTLFAVEEAARSGSYDFIVVDCAPTDTTLRLLTLPDVAHGALRLLLRLQRSIARVVTPLARSLVPIPMPGSEVFADAERLLYDKLRGLRRRVTSSDTSVRLVVTPERMVIDEARRAFTDLCLFDLSCDGVVMNRLLPEAALREEFFRHWGRLQAERVEEVKGVFAPLRVLNARLQDDEVVGLQRLEAHGRELFAACEPDAVLSRMERIRFSRDPDAYRVHLPLPGARVEELDVAKVEDELVVRAGSMRRALKLPRRIAPLALGSARLADGQLEVVFPRERKDARERRDARERKGRRESKDGPPVWEA
ncbi:MAG: ArsA family ATPase [Deltaproteobacteria bacterium]|nr:ArsA family ATPase [Deltaproteobacteria bacterium]MBW2418824.1 ArsA family ATPase [Deltaproteobacteria bacterium]